MPTDLQIARSITPRSIVEIGAQVGIAPEELEPYGRTKAKLSYPLIKRLSSADRARGKIVLVTAITPTPAGEGKTTVTIGLAQALCRLGKRAIPATREPSMGPVFGLKGGAAGGGYAQVIPMEDINLHFTGDMHALSAAHNLLAALLDNHLHQGNALGIDPSRISFKRVVDMNDRALRQVVVGLGGPSNGPTRESGFLITVASEVMAVFCLSRSLEELKARIGDMVVGQTFAREPVRVRELRAQGAMTALLRDAFKPNLVQTLEGTPALVHGGPFANIAHGCSSALATQLARSLGDVVVTEAGFGSDLGMEKYCDIVAPACDLPPDAVVLVATVRALKMHGGVKKEHLAQADLQALQQGLANLDRHVQNVTQLGVPFVIALNRFSQDQEGELVLVEAHARAHGWPIARCEVWEKGGEGGRALGEQVLEALSRPGHFSPLYSPEAPLLDKLTTVATRVYGATGIALSARAETRRRWLEAHGFGGLRVCIAKTPYSFSHDPKAGPNPAPFTLAVEDLELSAGAGFVVALTGEVMTMPGLGASPAAERIDVDENGDIIGLG